MSTNTPYDIMNSLWHSNKLTIAAATALGITDAQTNEWLLDEW